MVEQSTGVTNDVRVYVLGSDREQSVWYLLVAAGVLVVALGLLYWRWSVTPRGTDWGVLGVDLVWLVAAVAVGLEAVPGYLDDRLLVGWALGTAPFVARFLGPAVVPAMAFDQPILLGLATAVLFGTVVGSVGFVTGAGVRWVRETVRKSERTVGG